jgi:hypothetical protein
VVIFFVKITPRGYTVIIQVFSRNKLNKDSATLQSTQWIINTAYNQRLLSLLDLTTKYEANT